MGKNSHAFVFAIAASINSNFRTSFANATERINALSDGIEEYGRIQQEVYQASQKGIISQKALQNSQKQLAIYSRNAKQSITENFQKSFVDATAFYYGAKNIITGFLSPAQKAMQFESAMADVKKVVDFDSPQQFKEMEKDILRLTRTLPMTAEELSQIVAAGGQSGIAKNELIDFADSAAKMGIAFDISADKAGDMMAQWRTAFKMNQNDVIELSDKINYLGNTTAAKAPLISDVVTRIGPLGEVGGVASGEIAALGASLIGSGIQSEVAATGIKNFILTMTAGKGATKSQSEAFASLGLDAENVAFKMQKDAKGAIIEVLSALKDLDKVQQATTLAKLFGKESLSAIAPLLSNLEGLQENFSKVADKTKYAGSMEAEFNARSKTTENSIKSMTNKLDAAQIAIGQGLLPVLIPAVEAIGYAATAIGEFASEHPDLIKHSTRLAGIIIAVTGAWHMYNITANGIKATHLALNLLLHTQTAIMVKNFLVTNSVTAATVAWSTATKLATGELAMLKAGFVKLFAVMMANPFTILGMAAVGTALLIWKNWDALKEWFTTLWNNPKKAFDDFTKWVQEKWDFLRNMLTQPIFGSVSVNTKETKLATGVQQNAKGGIYNKGAFLTTFAENSPEAAIPIDGSQRAKNLWAQTGELLGVGNSSSIQVNFNPTINIQGNASREDVNQAMDISLSKLEDMLARLAHRQRRLSYG